MGKSRPPLGSLDSMASSIREKKAAASKTSLSRTRELQNKAKSKEFVDDTSSSASDSSDSDNDSGSGSGSGSDSEAGLDAARKKLAAKVASKNKNKTADVKVNGAKPTPVKATAPTSSTKRPTKPATKSTTTSSDAESESDSDDSDSNENAPSNGVAAKVDQSESESEESDSDSDSEGEEGAGAKLNTKKQSTSKSQPAAEAQSSSDESDSDASDASEESDDEATRSKKVAGDKTAVARVNGNTVAEDSTTQISRAPWLNSSDFMIRKASSDNPGKEVTEFFSRANLEGKQVWYFTAPASLPITVLKDMEIDLAKATAGGTLLNHKGDDYGLDLESNATNTQIQLLIPSQGGDKYTSLNRGIDSTVHLRRIAKFGPGGDVSATATKDYTPVPKPIRQQPKGLKPRFTPIGVPTPIPPKPLKSGRPAPPTTSKASFSNTPKFSDSASESESDSEGDSNEEMAEAPLPTSSASHKKLEKSSAVNGHKRKHPSDEATPAKESKISEKAAKRPKTGKSSTPIVPPSKALGLKKETPIQAPSLARVASAFSGSPSTEAPATKEKTKKKDKPAKALKKSSSKQTPIPPPTFPGIKH
ncbi:DNA-directed RNA polymerase I subunit RPA34.5-domain-containing protein [Whalleya microplaca]|nr:DNA-directed RNA polymerase I subunit RPA34.5-domain-containing protein [Whalleya microplaca]